MQPNDRQLEMLRLLESHISRLEGQTGVDLAAVEPNGSLDAAVQRWLQIAIQCCIDLGDSLLGQLGEPEPPRQRDVFPILVRRGIIDEATSEAMVELVRYRNTLIHAYESLSPAQTWAKMTSGIPILKGFFFSVDRLLTGS